MVESPLAVTDLELNNKIQSIINYLKDKIRINLKIYNKLILIEGR